MPVLNYFLLVASICVWHVTAKNATIQGTDSRRWVPDNVTIEQGDTVTWDWRGSSLTHNVAQVNTASGTGFRSGSPVVAGTFQLTFNTTGTFMYVCQVHASQGMTGQVIVINKTNSTDGGQGTPSPQLVEAVNVEQVNLTVGPVQIIGGTANTGSATKDDWLLVTFNKPFQSPPAVTLTPYLSSANDTWRGSVFVHDVTETSFEFTVEPTGNNTAANRTVAWNAVGTATP